MIVALMIALWVLIIGGALIAAGMKQKKLLQQGKIIKRKTAFWDEAEMFMTIATPQAVFSTIQRTDFSDCKVSAEYGTNIAVFKSDHSWNACVEYLGMQGERHVFKCNFPAYMSRKGMPYNVATMNIMLTSIEKIFLTIDPQTTVEVHKVKRTTKY